MAENIPNRAVIDVDEQLLNDITDLIHSKSDVLLNNILADIYPADIALIINNLDDDEALGLFKILPEVTAADVLLELKANDVLLRMVAQVSHALSGRRFFES